MEFMIAVGFLIICVLVLFVFTVLNVRNTEEFLAMKNKIKILEQKVEDLYSPVGK